MLIIWSLGLSCNKHWIIRFHATMIDGLLGDIPTLGVTSADMPTLSITSANMPTLAVTSCSGSKYSGVEHLLSLLFAAREQVKLPGFTTDLDTHGKQPFVSQRRGLG